MRGPAEGVMFGQVKIVDRLDFTMKNFSKARRGVKYSDLEKLPEPLNEWQPGAGYFLAKFQPLHIGHVVAIRRAAEKLEGRPLYILASDSAPDLNATHWRNLKVSSTKRNLKAGVYTHPFSARIREELLKAAFGQNGNIHFVNPAVFWEHLRRC